jgi:glycosyltransferase involved in cell wall biosynthesis
LPFERMRRYVLRHADFVVGRSRDAIDIVRAKGYLGPSQVVPNAVDIELFRPLNREASRKRLGVDGFVVGYIGRLVPRKGISDLLEALARCPSKINVVLAGDGPMEAEIRQLSQSLRVSHRIRLLGARPLDELPGLMAALDVLALPSRTVPSWKEQFGRVIIEAHACGIPVIGSSSGAIPDVVGSGGLIFPEGDPAALASAIIRLASDEAERQSMGRAGRDQVLKAYTWECVANQMHQIYRLVIAAPAARFRPSRAIAELNIS